MLRIRVTNERQQLEMTHDGGPIEIGRGAERTEARIVVQDRFISRDQLKIEELATGKILITNIGGPFSMSDGSTVEQDAQREMRLPVRLTAGYTQLEISDAAQIEEAEPPQFQTIARPQQGELGDQYQTSLQSLGGSPPVDILAQWIERLLTVQRAAAGSSEFYGETARALVDLVGLDHGLVLLRRKGNWDTVADHSRAGILVERSEFEVSQRILNMVVEQKRTFFEPLDESSRHSSLANVDAVVASPILCREGSVIGIVYGTRMTGSSANTSGIQPLEAQVVQLLAAAAGSGLARLEKEAEAVRSRVQFEQFCSPELARALERNPALLDGHESTVTVMFCDLRGFSSIAERCGTRTSYEILADAMETLTTEVIQDAGIVIDYHGDGMAAMWNAPELQTSHATMACRAAQAICRQIPDLNDRWEEKIGMPLKFGIGINSGPAQVGNAGSRRRMKYGPQGHTVNLASRVEGATKQFGAPILITDATHDLLADSLATRRICKVRVVGIKTAVNLYELYPGPPVEPWISICRQYEEALKHYEAGEWPEAMDCLKALEDDTGEIKDEPSRLLAKVAANCLNQPPVDFQGVFQLHSK
ncbi:MAG: adenylate/guanylate cyclase domain-containing protein [Planctomycetales bacterium]